MVPIPGAIVKGFPPSTATENPTYSPLKSRLLAGGLQSVRLSTRKSDRGIREIFPYDRDGPITGDWSGVRRSLMSGGVPTLDGRRDPLRRTSLFLPPVSRDLGGDGSGLLRTHTFRPAFVLFLAAVVGFAHERVDGLLLLTGHLHP